MKNGLGYYSVIQYCPDLSRLEAVNVGVLIFVPDTGRVSMKMSSTMRRLTKVFGKTVDANLVRVSKQSLSERLQGDVTWTLAHLERFILSRANVIQIAPLRTIQVQDVHQDLARLYAELVEEERRGTSVDQQSPERELGQLIESAGLEHIERNVQVTVPAFHRAIEVPFAYQNGRFNLLWPERFGSQADHNERKSAKLAIEGHSLARSPDPQYGDLSLVVFGDFRNAPANAKAVVRDILAETKVRLFDLLDPGALVEEIRMTARRRKVES